MLKNILEKDKKDIYLCLFLVYYNYSGGSYEV